MATGGDVQLTDKELLKLHAQRAQRQQFMEYLLKQVAEVTYQFNCFENNSLLEFATVRTRYVLMNWKRPEISNFPENGAATWRIHRQLLSPDW